MLPGTYSNQDGRSNGLTAPNPMSQASLLTAAWMDAGRCRCGGEGLQSQLCTKQLSYCPPKEVGINTATKVSLQEAVWPVICPRQAWMWPRPPTRKPTGPARRWGIPSRSWPWAGPFGAGSRARRTPTWPTCAAALLGEGGGGCVRKNGGVVRIYPVQQGVRACICVGPVWGGTVANFPSLINIGWEMFATPGMQHSHKRDPLGT